MKFRRQLAALVAVAMMIGCMPGFVLATETDESQTPTEQTTEVQEEEPAETVEEEDEDNEAEVVEGEAAFDSEVEVLEAEGEKASPEPKKVRRVVKKKVG